VIRRVVLTGASSGIGRESAVLLARVGCELVLAARRADPLEEAADACRAEGGIARAFVCDVSDPRQCEALVAVAREMEGDAQPVLVNAAGTAEFGDTATMSLEAIDEQIGSNLLGAIYLSRAILPWMLEGGEGQIVNVSSVAAVHAFPGAGAYCAAKAGLLMFGRSLAAEYRAQGVRVSALLPGSVDTPLWDGKSFIPERTDMLTPLAVAETVRDLVLLPPDRSVDEVLLMPRKGIL
jgi:NAD(P)-dependent dehydrogenase (short-subunit alcohol dehydrogenase family)